MIKMLGTFLFIKNVETQNFASLPHIYAVPNIT